MFNKIKEFFTGKPTQLEVEIKSEVPYKVEATAPKVEIVPAGTEASVAAPAAKAAAKPKAPAKPRAPKKPRSEAAK